MPHVRNCLSENIECFGEGYCEFANDAINDTYIYGQQMAFIFLHLHMLFRKGIHRNCSRSVLTSQSKLMLLFYGGNHPKYQKIVYNDLRQQVLMPDELKNIMESNFSASRTGSLGHFQSGDALLEEINKNGKKWILGVPNEQQ